MFAASQCNINIVDFEAVNEDDKFFSAIEHG